MNVLQKHNIALANIKKIYQAGWLPTVPYNSGIAPLFTCVADADRLALATLHINNDGNWLFVFTIGRNTHEFIHITIPTVKQVRHIFKTYHQTALEQGELITEFKADELTLFNLATAAGWVFFGVDSDKQNLPAIFVGRITEVYFAALSQQDDGWQVTLPFHIFNYTSLPSLETVKKHFKTVSGLIDNNPTSHNKKLITKDK